jgi:hypothetical protein
MKYELKKENVIRWLEDMYGGDIIEEIYHKAELNVMGKVMYDTAIAFAEDEIRNRMARDEDENNRK